jgi:hypothetical protein
MSQFFETASFRAGLERCADMVRRWLTACGKDSCYWRSEALAGLTDEQLADACIRAWGLDQTQGDDNHLTWFEVHGADRSLLIEAIAAVRFELSRTLVV